MDWLQASGYEVQQKKEGGSGPARHSMPKRDVQQQFLADTAASTIGSAPRIRSLESIVMETCICDKEGCQVITAMTEVGTMDVATTNSRSQKDQSPRNITLANTSHRFRCRIGRNERHSQRCSSWANVRNTKRDDHTIRGCSKVQQ